MRKVLDIPISFADKSLDDFEMYAGPQEPYYQAIVSLRVIWVDGTLNAEVTWNQELLYPSAGSSDTTWGQFTPNSSIFSGSEGLESRVAL